MARSVADENDRPGPPSARDEAEDPRTEAAPAPPQDLGIGSRAALGGKRFLSRDGSFNVRREGLSPLRSLSLYHAMLTMSWPRFFTVMVTSYFAVNLLFAFGYLACGEDALAGIVDRSFWGRAQASFFFSVHTVATIGYGSISPYTLPANLLVTVEALVGLGGFALATGLLFSRFSRPEAHIAFSDLAVIAPYRDGQALMFRVVNERKSQLIEVQATVNLGRNEGGPERIKRGFYDLGLERRRVIFFPLHWVIVHPIDEESPFFGVTEQDFKDSEAEIFVLLSGIDETFSQTVHARSSYRAAEVVWGARFKDMFVPSADGRATIDVRKLHDIEPVA
jgi:inward rectifier potassium channel